VIADFGIAKHLTAGEQLDSVAGSLGYVAPEVLSRAGHSKPVDIWSLGIITYVMLCGYSPFRSEDAKGIVAETARGRIEFHDRYWKNISQEAKDFILLLLKTDPEERPTADQAILSHWLTTHAPSTEHDISVGLRDNFSPRKKWQSAVYKLRAASRLNSGGMALRVREATRSGSIGGSGGWGDLISDDEDISNEGQEVISPSQDELHPPRQSLSPTVSIKTASLSASYEVRPTPVYNSSNPDPPQSERVDHCTPGVSTSRERRIPGGFEPMIYDGDDEDGTIESPHGMAASATQNVSLGDMSLGLVTRLKNLILR